MEYILSSHLARESFPNMGAIRVEIITFTPHGGYISVLLYGGLLSDKSTHFLMIEAGNF